jgi:hypothetical protein
MNKLPNQPWWSSMGFRKPEPSHDPDFADMGTAFGLDASMTPAPEPSAEELALHNPLNDRLNGRSVI